MINIQSNSQESLLKSKIREISSNETATRTIEYLDKLVKDFQLDYNKVATELLTAFNKTPDVQSPYGFFTKIAYKLAIERREEFKRDRIKICYLEFHQALDEEEFTGELWEKLLIDYIEEHCVNEFTIAIEDMINTNRGIMAYCRLHNIKTYKEYKDLLLKSRILKKCNVPLIMLVEKAKASAKEYETIYAELGGL